MESLPPSTYSSPSPLSSLLDLICSASSYTFSYVFGICRGSLVSHSVLLQSDCSREGGTLEIHIKDLQKVTEKGRQKATQGEKG